MTTLPAFDRHRPTSVGEATEMLASYGEDAVVYVGGTELFLLFKLGFAEYPHVIDLKGIPELSGIERRDGALRIGATETHRAIERDPLVREGWPSLAEMERGVGNLRVRTMGSIGGNLCFGDPHSDPATYLLAAGATLEARQGADGRREIPLGSFSTGPFENALDDGELLAGVSVPALAPGAAIAHRKFVLTERPAITVAAHLRLDSGSLADVRLAVGSAGTRASRAEAASRSSRACRPASSRARWPRCAGWRRTPPTRSRTPTARSSTSGTWSARSAAGCCARRSPRPAAAEPR